jgi:hypothetical protein
MSVGPVGFLFTNVPCPSIFLKTLERAPDGRSHGSLIACTVLCCGRILTRRSVTVMFRPEKICEIRTDVEKICENLQTSRKSAKYVQTSRKSANFVQTSRKSPKYLQTCAFWSWRVPDAGSMPYGCWLKGWIWKTLKVLKGPRAKIFSLKRRCHLSFFIQIFLQSPQF